ncbi:MAG TPA: magnesium chelatase [Ruminococcaceae bacterium]|nr:magnesium chelatase [Oscillospiraceae bacterium]
MAGAAQIMHSIVDNIENVIIGKRKQVELLVMCMASSGHALIEDVPGVGKTKLVRALARSVDCGFKRIQFTSDTLPSDITGYSVYNPKTGCFEFRSGAVFSNFILADEINRTTSKTQASLLEIMEEGQATVDGETYPMKQPFMVLATQNSAEFVGTYPLPEAEMDRFLVRVSLGYPSKDDEARVIESNLCGAAGALEPVACADDIMAVREAVSRVYVDEKIERYIVSIAGATRSNPDVLLGASPRGSVALARMCQSYALYLGRQFVIPDYVKELAPCVLAHRLVLTHEAKINKKDPNGIITDTLRKVPVPGPDAGFSGQGGR